MICRICHNEKGNKAFIAREMVFGYRDEFKYFECRNCGCLQIKELPDNISRYYPSDYYSYSDSAIGIKPENFLLKWARKKRALYGLSNQGLIGSVITKRKALPRYYEFLSKCNLNLGSKILEIGCGSGQFLKQLEREGFKNLFGIDPYLPLRKARENKCLQILHDDLDNFESVHRKEFDFVMLHHTLEHMLDHHKTFFLLSNLLKDNGYVWITMPVIGYAWRHYQSNWCGLDPPRHFIIHSMKSLEILCNESFLQMVSTTYNSTEYQFVASEQYSRDISLLDKRSYIVEPQNSIFTEEQVEYFKEKSIELNINLDGDSASFLLINKRK